MDTMGSINNTLSSNYLESVLNQAVPFAGIVQNPGITDPPANSTTSSSSIGQPIGQPQDSGQLSPLAQLLSTLQQVQQSDPTKYAQVTQQIATNLKAAAQTAQNDGNTTAATELSTLATDFTNASTSGQLPNIADLSQAVGGHGHGHGHHHHHGSSSDSTSSLSTDTSGSTSASSTTSPSTTASSTTSPSATSPNSTVSQFLASLIASEGNGASGTQNDSLNPAAIIFNTLAAAGITGSNA
jgi:hypothetical protein